jgi:hypothetical protein
MVANQGNTTRASDLLSLVHSFGVTTFLKGTTFDTGCLIWMEKFRHVLPLPVIRITCPKKHNKTSKTTLVTTVSFYNLITTTSILSLWML